MSKELQSKLGWKKDVNVTWEKGQTTWGQHKAEWSAQGRGEEGQAPLAGKSGRGCQAQQEGLFQVHQQQREGWGKCGSAAE